MCHIAADRVIKRYITCMRTFHGSFAHRHGDAAIVAPTLDVVVLLTADRPRRDEIKGLMRDEVKG